MMLIRSGNSRHPWPYGAKGRLPQDGPIWYEDYFELKTIKTQYIQEKAL